MRVLVIQSHRSPLPVPWIERCVDSVRAWAHDRKFDYRWSGDEIFEPLSVKLRHKTRHRKAVASDLARLYALRAALAEGYQQAVWVDADVLVFDPDALTLPDTDHAFGRENWVQLTDSGKPRIYRRIHNAVMSFSAESSFLDFYLYSAERILTRHKDQMVLLHMLMQQGLQRPIG